MKKFDLSAIMCKAWKLPAMNAAGNTGPTPRRLKPP